MSGLSIGFKKHYHSLTYNIRRKNIVIKHAIFKLLLDFLLGQSKTDAAEPQEGFGNIIFFLYLD